MKAAWPGDNQENAITSGPTRCIDSIRRMITIQRVPLLDLTTPLFPMKLPFTSQLLPEVAGKFFLTIKRTISTYLQRSPIQSELWSIDARGHGAGGRKTPYAGVICGACTARRPKRRGPLRRSGLSQRAERRPLKSSLYAF
jgi:hypothetical protein